MEEGVKKAERKIKNVEEAILILSEKMTIHDGWWDEHRAFQADTEAKIAALVDAQIKSEDEASELRSRMIELLTAQMQSEKENKAYRSSMKQFNSSLVEILKRMDERITNLENKKNGKNGKHK